MVKISDCRVSSFLKTVPGCGYLDSSYFIFIILIVHITCAAKPTKSEIILVMANYAKNDGPGQDPRRYICSRRNSNYVKILSGKSAIPFLTKARPTEGPKAQGPEEVRVNK